MRTLAASLAVISLLSLPYAVRAEDPGASIEARVAGQASPVGYNTVAEARADLFARQNLVQRTDNDGWIEIEDRSANALWLFVPKGNPAYPAVIRRPLTGRGMAVQADMSGLCEATKQACQALMRDLQKRNQTARLQLFRTPPRGSAAAKPDVLPIQSLLSN